MRSISILPLALLWSCPANAADRIWLSADWVVLGGGINRTVTLQEGKSQPYVEVMPKSVFRLEGDARDAKGNLVAPAGTVFTATRQRTDVRCEVKRRKRIERFTCLVDRNGDGQFDSHMRLMLNSELFISGAPVNVGGHPLHAPATMAAIDPRTDTEHFTIDLHFSNRAEFVGSNIIQICITRGDLKSVWGSKTDLRICLPKQITLKDRDYPAKHSLYGGHFTFASREKNRISVDIEPPKQDHVF